MRNTRFGSATEMKLEIVAVVGTGEAIFSRWELSLHSPHTEPGVLTRSAERNDMERGGDAQLVVATEKGQFVGVPFLRGESGPHFRWNVGLTVVISYQTIGCTPDRIQHSGFDSCH